MITAQSQPVETYVAVGLDIDNVGNKIIIRKYSFSQRTINEWNRPPGDCGNATSVNMFKNKKNKMDKYCKKS